MQRRTAREKALQALFQMDVSKTDWNEAITNVLDGKEQDEYLVQLVQGVYEQQTKIDELIGKFLVNWTLERLAIVDRNILRIGTYELLNRNEDVPPKVAINEAIEVAKKFGDENSGKFVNGVLSKIYESIQTY